MNAETQAALLGAVIGAGVTLLVTIVARVWSAQDRRAQSRRDYALAVAVRLQKAVKADTAEEIRDLTHELFGMSALAVYIPIFATPVHLWYVVTEQKVMDIATQKVKGDPDGRLRVDTFNEAIDLNAEITRWARGDLRRSAPWFWWQLRTRREYRQAVELAKPKPLS